MAENFKLYSQYYDLLYKDKDYVGEADYIVSLIKAHGPQARNLIELGSGTGKHAYLLAEKGFRILGLERSEEMVAIAKKQQHEEVSFEVRDITDFELDKRFDVAISLFHVISYLTTNQSLIQTFKNVNQHLNKEGLFIFDVWHSAAVNHQVPEKRTKTLKNETIEVVRKADPFIEPEDNKVTVNYEITITNLKDQSREQVIETHPMRHFSRPEIELLAYGTGFEVIHTEEFLSKAKPSNDTWGVCYVLKKIN